MSTLTDLIERDRVAREAVTSAQEDLGAAEEEAFNAAHDLDAALAAEARKGADQ